MADKEAGNTAIYMEKTGPVQRLKMSQWLARRI